MDTIYSTDLTEEKNDLQQAILDSFLENFPQYEDMTTTFEDILFEEEEIQDWKEVWLDELVAISEIEKLEDDIYSTEWEHGLELIEEDNFTEYCEDLVKDCGELPQELPHYIQDNINWEGVAKDLKVDYSEVNFRGLTYLYRT